MMTVHRRASTYEDPTARRGRNHRIVAARETLHGGACRVPPICLHQPGGAVPLARRNSGLIGRLQSDPASLSARQPEGAVGYRLLKFDFEVGCTAGWDFLGHLGRFRIPVFGGDLDGWLGEQAWIVDDHLLAGSFRRWRA